MSQICVTHLTWDCKICYPSSTSVVNPGATVPPSSVSPPTPVSSGFSFLPSWLTTWFSPPPPPPKRKRPVHYGPKNLPKKRIKKTVIDDEVACQIFRQLGLTNDFLNSGKVLAWALSPDDPAYYPIHEYVANGQVHNFGVKILSILRIMVNTADGKDILDFNDDPSAQGKRRLMLWHGTKKWAVPSILQNNLRLPHSLGQMYGPGIYFADRVSKSCFYCWSPIGSVAFLFLCDVLVGQVYDDRALVFRSSWAPRGFDSVRGCGHRVPDPKGDLVIDNCTWPLGKTTINESESSRLPLYFNEYIVYQQERVQPKYLVKVFLTSKPYFENLK